MADYYYKHNFKTNIFGRSFFCVSRSAGVGVRQTLVKPRSAASQLSCEVFTYREVYTRA